jgi:hypothetical protein
MVMPSLVRTLMRRWRVARYERRRLTDSLRDEGAAEHAKRQAEGIHDVHPGATGG